MSEALERPMSAPKSPSTSPPTSTAGRRDADDDADTPLTAVPGTWRMRWAQGVEVCRAELARQIARRRALGAMFLGLAPVLLLGAWALLAAEPASRSMADVSRMYSDLYTNLVMALVLFFGCVAVFSTLIRREVRDRTLHYHFLAPVRREVVLLGKYAGGVFTAWLIFGLSTVLSFALAYTPSFFTAPMEVRAFFFDGPGFGHLLAYLSVTALGVVGYGAVFLFMGMFFKNPVLPAIGVYFWEVGNFLLPTALKKVSVTHYLVALLPVPPSPGPFAILSDAPPIWLAVPGLLLVSAVLVGLAAWRAAGMEILYGED